VNKESQDKGRSGGRDVRCQKICCPSSSLCMGASIECSGETLSISTGSNKVVSGTR
jgi:hypothetical protein